jgi:hypothetical protein
MAEAFARKLLLEREKIGRLVLLLDFTIAQRHRRDLLFLQRVADEIYLCHTSAEDLRREIKGQNTDRAKAYLKGKLRTVTELRRQTLQFAKKGSPQAEAAMLDFLAKQNLSENA